MAENCKIEWVAAQAKHRGMASKSWNPVIGCSRAFEGCRNCYAAGIAHRFGAKGNGVYAGLTERDQNGTPRFTGKIDFSEKRLVEPLRWRKPAVVFVGDMADLFHDNVTDAMLDRIFAVMALRPDCLFLVLTKRPDRMREYVAGVVSRINPMDFKLDDWPLPNVWLGVTAENQAAANERIPHLLATPAAKRFLSAEPMLGPVKLRQVLGDDWTASGLSGEPRGLDWVICGGESGPGARPMHPDWARALRDQCVSARVPFFFKQWGEWAEADLCHHENGKASIFCLEHDPASEEQYARRKTPRYAEWKELDPVPPFTCRIAVARVGKKAAGRLLDGREWNEVPT